MLQLATWYCDKVKLYVFNVLMKILITSESIKMSTITLLEKLYGEDEKQTLSFFTRLFESESSNLNVRLEVLRKNDRNWIQISLSGEDAPVMVNYLHKKFGLAPLDFNEVHSSALLRGKVVSSGIVGYGLYVDIGISSPKHIDALIPLHKLRQQLAKNNQLSCREILNLYCLYDNFPLEAYVTQLNRDLQTIEAEFSEKQISIFKEWIKLDLDRIIILGLTLDQVEKAVYKSGVQRDIAKIEELGLLEHMLVCKLGTDARGLITRLGPLMSRLSLRIFDPKKVRSIMMG